VNFELDENKNSANNKKHSILFEEAQLAFLDKNRIILEDVNHSDEEKRYFCIGKVKHQIITVRFTHRKNKIRIIGAGLWCRGRDRGSLKKKPR